MFGEISEMENVADEIFNERETGRKKEGKVKSVVPWRASQSYVSLRPRRRERKAMLGWRAKGRGSGSVKCLASDNRLKKTVKKTPRN